MNPRSGTRIILSAVLICLAIVLDPFAFAQEQRDLNSEFKRRLSCDIDVLFTPYTTRSDFTVKVANDGASASDVTVVLRNIVDATPSVTRKTDSRGLVKFSSIRRGKYQVEVEELLPTFAEVTVDPDSDETEDVLLEWPNGIEAVRNLRGTLVSADDLRPIEGVRVELLDVRTARLIADTRTDAMGFYEIDGPNTGLYVLRFVPADDSEDHQDLGVKLTNDGVSDQLPVVRLSTDCGIELSPVR